MSITGQPSSVMNTFCIQYWPINEPNKPKVMRRINSNGVVVQAKKYSEVFMFDSLQAAWADCKWFYEHGYDCKVRKCALNKQDTFWLL